MFENKNEAVGGLKDIKFNDNPFSVDSSYILSLVGKGLLLALLVVICGVALYFISKKVKEWIE